MKRTRIWVTKQKISTKVNASPTKQVFLKMNNFEMYCTAIQVTNWVLTTGDWRSRRHLLGLLVHSHIRTQEYLLTLKSYLTVATWERHPLFAMSRVTVTCQWWMLLLNQYFAAYLPSTKQSHMLRKHTRSFSYTAVLILLKSCYLSAVVFLKKVLLWMTLIVMIRI